MHASSRRNPRSDSVSRSTCEYVRSVSAGSACPSWPATHQALTGLKRQTGSSVSSAVEFQRPATAARARRRTHSQVHRRFPLSIGVPASEQNTCTGSSNPPRRSDTRRSPTRSKTDSAETLLSTPLRGHFVFLGKRDIAPPPKRHVSNTPALLPERKASLLPGPLAMRTRFSCAARSAWDEPTKRNPPGASVAA
jgi:hypothetical protein